jgi:thymidylate synthase
MKQYLNLCQHVLDTGIQKGDRTGTGTLSTFGYQTRYNLQEGFPLLTTKDMSGYRFKGIIHELLWFLSGNTNIKYLNDNKTHIWNPDAYRQYKEKLGDKALSQKEFVALIKSNDSFAEEHGELGPIYGKQWVSWDTHEQGKTINQIADVINQIKINPDSRRLIVSAWNVAQINGMCLPPCHVLFQFYVGEGNLSCQLYQRSADGFLGYAYNLASYSLLVHMVAQQTGLEVGEFIHTLGDLHIYNNHIDQVKLQLTREPKKLPTLKINRKPESIFDYKVDDFELVGYECHPEIKGKVSVGLKED